jgi:hypothetical protein
MPTSTQQGIWEHGWRSFQIIIRELLLAVVLVLGLSAMAWLLHQGWLGLDTAHISLVERIHFYYSAALMILFPLKSIRELV